MIKHLLNTLGLFLIVSNLFGQKNIHLSIIESNTLKEVSFVKISISDTSFITGISGEVDLQLNEKDTLLSFECYPFINQEVNLDIIKDSITVKLQSGPFEILSDVHNNANHLIYQITKEKRKNNPKTYAPYYYTTYNKFFIETDQISQAKSLIDKFVHSFSLKRKDFEDDHLILLTESTTQRRYIDDICEDEIVTASKVSGVEKPLLLTMNSQLLPFSFYENYINIGKKEYTNPLAKNPLHQYNFKCIDTTNEFYTVIFSPKKTARFEGLKGVLYIDHNTKAISKAIYTPSKEAKNVKLTLVVEFKENEKGLFLPYQVKTLANMENVGSKHMKFLASATTVYSSITLDTTFNRETFDEFAIKYNPDTTSNKNEYWNNQRQLPFTSLDSNTYAFYDTVGSIKNFENLVYIGERIVFKKVPYKFLDFNLKRVIGLNEFEGLRLGIGAETNERLLKKIRFGAYVGRGLKDKLTKYGLHARYLFLNKKESSFKISYYDDVSESGGHNYYMDKYQYSSEWLRKLKIKIMERVRHSSIEYFIRPEKFLYLRFGLHQSLNTIYDNYRYIDYNKTNYNYTEIKASVHYQFGQRYLKLLNEKYPFERKYPHIWFEYTKGVKIENIGNFDYHKLEVKINYNHRFLNLGVSGIEISGGWVNKSLPYYKLFNGKGSAEISTVAHNSFETMGYNEFFSDHYLSLFYSHDFGYWNFFYNPNFRPRLELAYNLGVGGLQDRSDHKNIDYKSLDKLYMEAGFLINNILTVNITAIKAGFGMGVYYRFGAYSNDTFVGNTFFKISTTFNL